MLPATGALGKTATSLRHPGMLFRSYREVRGMATELDWAMVG